MPLDAKNLDITMERGQAKRSSLISPKELPVDSVDDLSVSQADASPNVKAIAAKPFQGSALLPNLPLDDIKDKSNMIIGSYQITKTLGQGTFGKVKEGIHLFTKQKVSAAHLHGLIS
jgi:serine/threonine protein kinase